MKAVKNINNFLEGIVGTIKKCINDNEQQFNVKQRTIYHVN